MLQRELYVYMKSSLPFFSWRDAHIPEQQKQWLKQLLSVEPQSFCSTCGCHIFPIRMLFFPVMPWRGFLVLLAKYPLVFCAEAAGCLVIVIFTTPPEERKTCQHRSQLQWLKLGCSMLGVIPADGFSEGNRRDSKNCAGLNYRNGPSGGGFCFALWDMD